jgi:chromatin remodeling complex protein RSC6
MANTSKAKQMSTKAKVKVTVKEEVVEVDEVVEVEKIEPESPKNVIADDNIQAFHTKLLEYNSKINDHVKQIKDLQQLGKSLEKDFLVIGKMVAKTAKKIKNDKPRPLSGFAVPSLLTDELYDFLKINKGELVPRKDVTKMINEYIKDHNCRDEKDKRNILPDDALTKLFRSSEQDKITYFNLQTYLKHHYIKSK